MLQVMVPSEMGKGIECSGFWGGAAESEVLGRLSSNNHSLISTSSPIMARKARAESNKKGAALAFIAMLGIMGLVR